MASVLSREREVLFGKPHIGDCWYTPSGDNKMDHDALCAICGRKAGSAHHIVQKGAGGGSKYLSKQDRTMSPLIAVCGYDNVTGCHGKLHQHDLSIRWEFYGEEPDVSIRPHSSSWYDWGYYVVSDRDGNEVRIGS